MTEFDDILNAEKARNYKAENPDLLAFATITQIAHEEAQARIKRRFKISVLLSIVVVAALLQVLALSHFNFSNFSHTLAQLLNQHPFAITIANLGFVAALLFARRLRFI